MTPPLCLLLASGGSAAVILRDILLIFLAAKLLAEVAERLRQPPVVGELLAGILIGPALLGWVQPNELLSTLAELGVLFLLFRVGLELKDFDLARVGSTALLVAILGVIVPFLMGWGIMLAFGEAQVGAVFVGAAMVATSVGITARVLAGKGLLQELLFALSLAAVYAGVAAIIGAFLAGMALANSIGDQVHEMMSGVTELLVPFFLVGIGLHFDLSAFAGRTTIVIALVILVAAVISKFVGCAAGALSLGWTEAVRVGAGMIPRGEVGMVVAQIGLGLHVIPAATYGVVVFMSIATTMIAPPLLKVAYRGAMESHREPREVPRVG